MTLNIFGATIPVTQTTNDTNGNPRYIVHFLSLGLHDYASTKATREAGMKKHIGKSYGGGFVFQSHNVQDKLETYFASVAAEKLRELIDFSSPTQKPNYKNVYNTFLEEKKHEFLRYGKSEQDRNFTLKLLKDHLQGLPNYFSIPVMDDECAEFLGEIGLDRDVDNPTDLVAELAAKAVYRNRYQSK